MIKICGSAIIVITHPLRSLTQNHMWKQSMYKIQDLSVHTVKLFVPAERPCQHMLAENTNKCQIFWWLTFELWNKENIFVIFVKNLLLIIRSRWLHSIQNAEDPRRNVAMFVLFPGVQSENQYIWAYWSKPCWDPWLLLWCLFQALSDEKCPESSQTQRA